MGGDVGAEAEQSSLRISALIRMCSWAQVQCDCVELPGPDGTDVSDRQAIDTARPQHTDRGDDVRSDRGEQMPGWVSTCLRKTAGARVASPSPEYV